MKLSTLVYPFDLHFLPLIRHDLFADLDFEYFVSPKGWGYAGRDIGTIDYGAPLGKQITSDFDEALNRCQVVFISQSDKFIDKDAKIIPSIIAAIDAGKRVDCIKELTEDDVAYIKSYAQRKKSVFNYYCNNLDHYSESIKIVEKQSEHKSLETPVMMVFSLIEQLSKFDIQIGLTAYLRGLGYKVSLVTSRSYGLAIGEHSLPNFLFSKHFSEYEKILLFNNYIKSLEVTESPDIFVIGVPGGIMPINEKILNRYGITAYEMSTAVAPDVSIVCSQCENFTSDYFDNLSKRFEHRFSMLSPLYFIDNTFIDFTSNYVDGFDIMKIDDKSINLSELFSANKNIFSRISMQEMFSKTIDVLSSDSDLEIA